MLFKTLLFLSISMAYFCMADERRSASMLPQQDSPSTGSFSKERPSAAQRNRQRGSRIIQRGMKHRHGHRHRLDASAGQMKPVARVQDQQPFRYRAFQQVAYEVQNVSSYPSQGTPSPHDAVTDKGYVGAQPEQGLAPLRTASDEHEQDCIPDYLSNRFSKENGVQVSAGEMLCPNAKLATMVADTYDAVRSEHPERQCNVVTANKKIQSDLKDAFGYDFDSVIAYGDFSSKSHMSKADLFCKMKHDNKYIMVFATPSMDNLMKELGLSNGSDTNATAIKQKTIKSCGEAYATIATESYPTPEPKYVKTYDITALLTDSNGNPFRPNYNLDDDIPIKTPYEKQDNTSQYDTGSTLSAYASAGLNVSGQFSSPNTAESGSGLYSGNSPLSASTVSPNPYNLSVQPVSDNNNNNGYANPIRTTAVEPYASATIATTNSNNPLVSYLQTMNNLYGPIVTSTETATFPAHFNTGTFGLGYVAARGVNTHQKKNGKRMGRNR